MANETPQMELDLLERRAAVSNCRVFRHQYYDPTRTKDGVPCDLYLTRKKELRTDPTEYLGKYMTADQVNAKLRKMEQEANYARQHQD